VRSVILVELLYKPRCTFFNIWFFVCPSVDILHSQSKEAIEHLYKPLMQATPVVEHRDRTPCFTLLPAENLVVVSYYVFSVTKRHACSSQVRPCLSRYHHVTNACSSMVQL